MIAANGILAADVISTIRGRVTTGSSNDSLVNAGVAAAKSNLVVDGTSTLAGSVVIGAGYGQAGVTITDTGAVSMDSNLVA